MLFLDEFLEKNGSSLEQVKRYINKYNGEENYQRFLSWIEDPDGNANQISFGFLFTWCSTEEGWVFWNNISEKWLKLKKKYPASQIKFVKKYSPEINQKRNNLKNYFEDVHEKFDKNLI